MTRIPRWGGDHRRTLYRVECLCEHAIARTGARRHATTDLDRIARDTLLDTHTPALAATALSLCGLNLAVLAWHLI